MNFFFNVFSKLILMLNIKKDKHLQTCLLVIFLKQPFFFPPASTRFARSSGHTSVRINFSWQIKRDSTVHEVTIVRRDGFPMSRICLRNTTNNSKIYKQSFLFLSQSFSLRNRMNNKLFKKKQAQYCFPYVF